MSGHTNVPSQTPTRQPYYDYSEKPLHFSRFLRCAWGYARPILVLKPQGPDGRGDVIRKVFPNVLLCTATRDESTEVSSLASSSVPFEKISHYQMTGISFKKTYLSLRHTFDVKDTSTSIISGFTIAIFRIWGLLYILWCI